MPDYTHPYRTMVVLMFVLGVSLAGCAAKKEVWYQEGKRQVDYDQDAQECTIIAGEFARQATISGTSEDLATFQRTMITCLAGKGWSLTPPQPPATGAETAPPAETESLAAIDGETIRVFGAQITLPAGFSLATGSRSGAGPSIVQTFLFSGPGETYVNVMAQRTVQKANRFEYSPYPVLPPFFLYEQGRQGSIFCGKINGQWVMGLGRYLLINARERITVIVTRPLVEPQTEPEPGFRLSREQFAQVEVFKKEWLEWLGAKVTLPPRSWWSRLRFLKW